MSRSLPGRVVAVTGGARGIGRAIAERLAGDGACVAIGDRDVDGACATASEMPGTAMGLECDVSEPDSFRAFLGVIETRWGPVDVLVNNAGVMWVGGFDEEPDSATGRQLAVNLRGVITGVKSAATRMRSRGSGQIVTVASAAAKLAPPGEATYAASKHGVFGYLSAVRAELRGSGVTVSVVMPGVVDTELAAGTSTGAARMLRPDDVAGAVVAVIRRPRFEVTVPGYVGPLARWVNLLPQRGRDLLLRLLVPDQVTSVPDKTARAGYEARNLGGNDH